MKHRWFPYVTVAVTVLVLLSATAWVSRPPAPDSRAVQAEWTPPPTPVMEQRLGRTNFLVASDADVKGQTIPFAELGIGGYPPSECTQKMFHDKFIPYAKDKYGYDVDFTYESSPWDSLFQKMAATLATRAEEYNLCFSDSQWLGAFTQPGWIINMNTLIEQYPDLNIEWYDPLVIKTYMTYPDNTSNYVGLPVQSDTQVLYVRQDLFTDPKEKDAFKAKYGWDLPQTFEDWAKDDLTWDKFENIAAFFTRPDQGLWGTSLQHSKQYDFTSMFVYNYMFSLGGEIWDPATKNVYGIINTDVNAKALEYNKHILDSYEPPGSVNAGITEQNDYYTSKKVATMLQWASMGNFVAPTDELRKITIAVPPPTIKRADGSIARVYGIGGQPWVVNAFNDPLRMRVAIDFLRWWYQPDIQMEYAKCGGCPSDKVTLGSDALDATQVWFQAHKFMMHDALQRDFWHEPTYSALLAEQQEGWHCFVAGDCKDAKAVNEWIACQQQKTQYEAGRTTTPPPDSCKTAKLQ